MKANDLQEAPEKQKDDDEIGSATGNKEEHWYDPGDEEAALEKYELALHNALEVYKADLMDIKQVMCIHRLCPSRKGILSEQLLSLRIS